MDACFACCGRLPIAIGDSVVRGIDHVDSQFTRSRRTATIGVACRFVACRSREEHFSMTGATRASTIPAVTGVLMGIALHQYARSGNGYIVGPGILAAFVSFLALLLLGAVLVVLRKRRQLGVQLIVFVVTSMSVDRVNRFG